MKMKNKKERVKKLGIVGNILKFIYVFFHSIAKALTVDFYHNFKEKWNSKPKTGTGYKKVNAPDHIDYSKPEPDYREVGFENEYESNKKEPSVSSGASVFDIFN